MPRIFAAFKNAIVIFLVLGLSFLCSAPALAENDSADELIQRIDDLYQQGKYKEAIPLAEKLRPSQNRQVVVFANPRFDKDVSIQIAKSDLPTEGSGVLRGTEKRDFEDLSFQTLTGTQQESDRLLAQF